MQSLILTIRCWYTQLHKWLPEVNKQKFAHPQATSMGNDRRGSGRGRVCSLMQIICGGSAEYYVNQKACYIGLPSISSTVCISRTTQSRSELSADLTCSERGGGVNIVLFILGSHL